MPRRTTVALSAAALAAALTGCAVGATAGTVEPAAPEISEVTFPEASPGHLLLYNEFSQRMVSYDPGIARVVDQTTAPNYSQYSFPDRGDLFTSGNSVGFDFEIVQVAGDSAETVLELPDGEGIFPFATGAGQVLFTHSTYDSSSRETGRRLVALEDGALVPYTAVHGAVDKGVVIGDQLYLTTYVPESDDYQLHVLPVADRDAEPRLLDSGLPFGGLYVHDGELVTATADGITDGTTTFDCVDLCWFHDDQDVLLRMHLDDEASLTLDVLDSGSGEVLSTHHDVVDFAVEDGELVVYREGGIDRGPVRGAGA